MRSPFLCAGEAPTTRKVSEWWEKLVCRTFLLYTDKYKSMCWKHFYLQAPADFHTPHLIWFCLLSSGKTTGIPIHVFGTETHMTAIVGMALGHRPIPNQPPVAAHTANFLLNSSGSTSVWHILTPRRLIDCHNVVSAHCAVNLHHQLHLYCGVVQFSSRRLACHSLCFSYYCHVLLVNQIIRSPVALLYESIAGHCALLSLKQSWDHSR